MSMFFGCCCDVVSPGYDVLWGGSNPLALVGVIVDGVDVYAYGFTDIENRNPPVPNGFYSYRNGLPTTADRLRLGRFTSVGDLNPQQVTPGDSLNNSYKTFGHFFNLQSQLTTLASHPDALYKPVAPGFRKGIRAGVDTMFDIGGGKTFCTLITESVDIPGDGPFAPYFVGSLPIIVDACWIDENGEVVDAWTSPTPREVVQWFTDENNIYRPDCPFDISRIYGEMGSRGSYKQDELVFYDFSITGILEDYQNLAVAYLVDREGQSAEWITKTETYYDSAITRGNPFNSKIPTDDVYRIPGVPVSGIVITDGSASLADYDSGTLSRTERLALLGTFLPTYCAVTIPITVSLYNPQALVSQYSLTREIIDTSDGRGLLDGTQGYGLVYLETWGMGRRVGPGTLAEMDLALYTRPLQYVDTPFGFVTDDQGFSGLWGDDTVEEDRVIKHYTLNGSPVTLEVFEDDPVVFPKYQSAKNTTVVLGTHSLLEVTIEAGAPLTSYTPDLCTYDITYDRTTHGLKLFCAVHDESGDLLSHTTAPIFSGSSTPGESIGHIAPFYSAHGVRSEIPNIVLEPNALGKQRGVFQWDEVAQPGKLIRYAALDSNSTSIANNDLRVFWGNPTTATDARFVLNCRWSGTSTAASANWYGSDLVFMRDAETILSVCRILGEVVLFEATSQGVYLEQRIYEGNPVPRRTGLCFKRDGTAAFYRQLGAAIFINSNFISSSPGLGDYATLHPFQHPANNPGNGYGSTGTLIREHHPETGTILPDSLFTETSWVRTAPPYTPPGQ